MSDENNNAEEEIKCIDKEYLEKNLKKLFHIIMEKLKDSFGKVHPVGTYYSTDSLDFNPNDNFVGTWTLVHESKKKQNPDWTADPDRVSSLMEGLNIWKRNS